MQRFIVLAAIALFSGLASAATLLAEVDRVSPEINSIQLIDDGTLAIETASGSQEIKLSAENFRTLIPNAVRLQNIELVTKKRNIVCKMMVPHPQNLSINNGKYLRATLTNRSCAFGTVVTPKEAYLLEIAVELKATMIALAQQLVK